MQWGSVTAWAGVIAAGVAVAMWHQLPRACNASDLSCPDEYGNLHSVGMFEGEPCNEGGLGHGRLSCEFLRRYKSISTIENSPLTDGWAGLYQASHDMGSVELALDRDGWAALTASSDIGGTTYEGRYEIESGQIVVRLGAEWQRWQRKDRLVYVPMKWGPRQYLVQGDAFADFVNWANAGYYRNGDGASDMWFALPRLRDREKPLCGLPELPAEWKTRVHSVPLVVSITHIERDTKLPRSEVNADDQRYRIEIDAGLRSGVFDGMELRLPSTEDCGGASVDVVLDDVDASRARGRLSVSGPSKNATIAVGMKLTTASRPWQLPECAIEPAPPS